MDSLSYNFATVSFFDFSKYISGGKSGSPYLSTRSIVPEVASAVRIFLSEGTLLRSSVGKMLIKAFSHVLVLCSLISVSLATITFPSIS